MKTQAQSLDALRTETEREVRYALPQVKLDLADKCDKEKVELEAHLELLSLKQQKENRELIRERQDLGDR